MARKRPYSQAFTARTSTPHRYLLDGIPPTLWEKAQQKARREHLSMRAALLTLLTEWVDGEAPGDSAQATTAGQIQLLVPQLADEAQAILLDVGEALRRAAARRR